MKKLGVGWFLFLLFIVGFCAVGSAQFGVGIQSPLAVFGSVILGPFALETGIPLQLDLASLGAFASTKLFIGKLELKDLVFRPFLGASGKVKFSNLSAFHWLALIGLEIYLEKPGVNVFSQLGFAPDAHTGLIESFVLGMRYDL